MKTPKVDKPPYTPITPVTDTMIGGATAKPLFGVSTAPSGIMTNAASQKKALIGGSA